MYIIQYQSISKVGNVLCTYTIAMIDSGYELEIRINGKHKETVKCEDIKYLTAYASGYVAGLKCYYKSN